MSAMRLNFAAIQATFGFFVLLSVDAQDFTLSHNNSSAQINITNASAGVLNWKVDGVNNLSDQRFFYRVGLGGPEALVQSISSSPIVSFIQIPNVLSILDVTYANASFSVRTVFQLTGGTGASGISGLSEIITVKNLTGSILDFHLFQYSDFDLYGLTGGQSAQYSFDALGQPYKVTQTDGIRSVTETLNASTATISHYDAALAGATLASLQDGSATVLGDNASAAGNTTFAYQWDAALSPNGTLTISKLLNIVPEPSAAALFLAGISAMFLRHRSTQ